MLSDYGQILFLTISDHDRETGTKGMVKKPPLGGFDRDRSLSVACPRSINDRNPWPRANQNMRDTAARLVARLRGLEGGRAMDRATGARCLRGAAAELAGTRNRLARLLSETGGDLAGVAGALRVARRVAGDLDLGETLALAAGKIEEVLDRLDRERQRLDFESEGGAQ